MRLRTFNPYSMNKASRAFSLVELLIVVIVIGILGALVVPNFARAKDKSSDGIRMTHMKAIADALDQYYGAFDMYPVSHGWSGYVDKYGGKDFYGPNAYIPGLTPKFLKELPEDPTVAASTNKGYLYRSDGKNYKFLAHQTPKNYDPNHQYYDPKRPTWSWMISTPGGKNW